MKRIISLIMSVLMIATMFCGMAVTSTAADGDLVSLTVDVTDNGDGTYTADIWVADNSEFGWYTLGFDIGFDEEKLELVVASNWEDKDYYIDQSNMLYWTEGANTRSILKTTKQSPSVANQQIINEDDYTMYVASTEAKYISIAAAGTGSNLEAIQFNYDFIKDEGIYDEAYAIAEESGREFYLDENKGVLWASMTLKAKDGATGDAIVWAREAASNYATDDNSDKDFSMSKERGVYAESVISLGSGEPAAPALPENVNTLEVQTGVSARKDTYNGDNIGLRFTTKVDVDNWTGVSEMGTAIVVAGTKPGAAPTLTVPARVDINGKYLQAHTKNEDGKYVFTPGITTADTNVTYTGVISNIKPENVDVEFEAYAYIIVDGVTYYSANSESASYNEIFNAAQNDPTIAD